MSSALVEDTFVEVFESGLSVDVVGDDAGPVVVTAVAGGPLGESLEFARCVASIVPTVPTATLALILEIALDGASQRSRCGFLTGGFRRSYGVSSLRAVQVGNRCRRNLFGELIGDRALPSDDVEVFFQRGDRPG